MSKPKRLTFDESLKISVGELRRVVREAFEDVDLNTVEVGDVVDVDMEYEGRMTVRVVELLDDVDLPSDDLEHTFTHEPGFVGRLEYPTDKIKSMDEELTFPLSAVVPGSKAKGYFPSSEYGRDMDEPNPYRDMAHKR